MELWAPICTWFWGPLCGNVWVIDPNHSPFFGLVISWPLKILLVSSLGGRLKQILVWLMIIFWRILAKALICPLTCCCLGSALFMVILAKNCSGKKNKMAPKKNNKKQIQDERGIPSPETKKRHLKMGWLDDQPIFRGYAWLLVSGRVHAWNCWFQCK